MNNQLNYWQLQKAANLSNSQAAEYLGVHISTVKRWRNGDVQVPKAVLLALELKVLKDSEK